MYVCVGFQMWVCQMFSNTTWHLWTRGKIKLEELQNTRAQNSNQNWGISQKRGRKRRMERKGKRTGSEEPTWFNDAGSRSERIEEKHGNENFSFRRSGTLYMRTTWSSWPCTGGLAAIRLSHFYFIFMPFPVWSLICSWLYNYFFKEVPSLIDE